MQGIIDNLLQFLCFLYLRGLSPTLAPAAYSLDSVAKHWPRYCEAQGSKPCRSAILVPFCEAFIFITVSYSSHAGINQYQNHSINWG